MTLAPLAHSVVPPRRRRSFGLRGLLLLAIVLGLAGVAGGGLVLGAVLLFPALIVLMLESSHGRPATRATFLFGLAASMPSVMALLQAGGSFQAGLGLAFDPDAVVRAWIAQGGGWLLTELIPFVLDLQGERAAKAEMRELQKAREALASEWAHLSAPPPPPDSV